FCRPTGWVLSAHRQPPEFFVAILTDIDADRHYLACLTFNESVSLPPTKSDDVDAESDDTDNSLAVHSLMFSPKCLVVVSRLDYFETFRNCLGIIYSAYVDKLEVQLEVLVGNILGCVQVPPPGIQNTIQLFCAALTDHKILFLSQSLSRLTDACQAITILQYPLKYSYVYIPILPAPLVEVLDTPTPFIAGIHSSLVDDTSDLVDVIIVDLDGGSVKIPECVNLPMLPEPILTRTKKALTMIVSPDLLTADHAFPPPSPKRPPSLEQKDKEIRAVFIRLFAELFTGYRSCLTVIRIHPEPFITFHKANFLGHRGMVEDDFLVRVLDSMGFSAFVSERGTPYRVCDVFDEVYASMQDQLKLERADPDKMIDHIKDLAKQLHTNEVPNPQPYVQKVPKPTDGAYSRIHHPPFPYLDWLHVQEIIDEGMQKFNIKSKITNIRPQQVRVVPMGPHIATLDRQRTVDNNARRLEVLRNCITFVFENKISDARIIFPAVLRALKSRVARLAMTQELGYHIRSNRAMLEHQQFDLVVKLLNCALQVRSNRAMLEHQQFDLVVKLLNCALQVRSNRAMLEHQQFDLVVKLLNCALQVRSNRAMLEHQQFDLVVKLLNCALQVRSNRAMLEHQQFDLVVKLLNCALQVRSNRAMLEHQQFDLIVKLLNCALQVRSNMAMLEHQQFDLVVKLLNCALQVQVRSNRAMLEHQQFDLVVKLLNCALQVRSNRAMLEHQQFDLVVKLLNCALQVRSNRAMLEHQQFDLVVKLLNCALQVRSNRAMLEHQQFDLVVKLLNCALQNDSSMDENGVAAAILPLATSFCRKLCTGIIQFAYTCVQEHAVWANIQFWEAAFYQDVQKEIRQLYVPQYEENTVMEMKRESRSEKTNGSTKSSELCVNQNNRSNSITPETGRRASYKPREIGALEIAAEQLRIWPTLNKDQQQEMINNEESTVYSQAIHYANRMVFMRVPLETSKPPKSFSHDWESTSNSNIASSLADSESVDAESGYDEMEISDVGNNVVKFVTRFVDKVCNDSKVNSDHIKALHQMIPGVVHMHIETLEAVNRESKRLPPIQKPKILKPSLLHGEEVVMDGLRVYLLPDGREEGLGGNVGGPSLLPAEGAIFLTNYRIIYKGIPCDPMACEQVIVRYFPISTLTKEKNVKLQYTPHIDQLPKEGLQLRANIFQLMKIAFDEEVSAEDIEAFRKLASKYRNPATIFQTFAFVGQAVSQPTQTYKHKEKHATLKNFALVKTLKKTARKAGIAKPKQPRTKTKYLLPTPPTQRRSMSPRSSAGSDSESDRPNSEIFDDLSIIDESEYSSRFTADPKNLERLMERPGYQDFIRLGFMDVMEPGPRARAEQFRITSINANFSVCRSYPALMVVPNSITDDSIRKLARTHRQYRFPVVSWRHPRTKALLLRASGFHSRGLMGMLKSDSSTGNVSGEISSALQQERYFKAIVDATPNSMRLYRQSCSDSLTSLDSLMMAGTTDTLTVPETPDVLRRHQYTTGSLRNLPPPKASSRDSLISLAESNPGMTGRSSVFKRAVNSLRASGGKGYSSFSRIGSTKDKGRLGTATLDLTHHNGTLTESKGDLINSSVQGFKQVALYVLGEKAQMKGIKMESFPKCDFIPVDFYEVRHVKASFKKLMRACVPSAPLSQDNSYLKAVEESEWLLQIQNILQLAGAVVDLMDVQGSSVMMCLEDGWDITTQVLSIAQLLSDPHYRTIEGFKSLVEKEWLSFGHRFTHRSNQTAANQASGFAPIFLQFLDAVHQIHNQFPLSFEFNQYYLRFLAYHYVSNRFRTFMMDNEYERVEAGWLFEERKTSKFDHEPGHEDGGFGTHRHSSSSGMSVWDYIDKYHRKSSRFMNFLHSPLDQEAVLRPYSQISNLKVWDYYFSEDLAHGPSYEIDIVHKEIMLNEEEASDRVGQQKQRRIVNGCYDNVLLKQPDVFMQKLQEIHNLETDLGHFQQKWRALWDKLECPNREHIHRNVSFNTQIVKSHGRSIHKRSTLEILVKGKMLGEAAKMFSQPHRFEKYTYTTPAYCDYCNQVLWGLLKTGMHCADCGYNCHEKCMSHVPKNCTKLKIVPDATNSSSNISRGGVSEASSAQSGMSLAEPSPSYEQYSTSSSTEHRTHEGYLFKRGALLKGWKQRWFVLDLVKHQLRYYDNEEDPSCKGYIDLFDVISVQPIKNVQGAPKRSDENAFFELKTNKRFYHFLAQDAKTALEWIEKIQSFI
ncbi:hypothetical protein FSP39_015926, partial [Pinctada imbricata]